jgi:two-component system nitrogen regulation response regulator GlnG
LQRRDWYGNVRELRNAVEHAMILSRGGMIAPEHLPPPMLPANSEDPISQQPIPSLIRQWAETQLQGFEDTHDLYEQLLKIVEPPLFKTAMEYSGGQCIAAARRLGIHRTTLRKKLDELEIGD